MNDVYTPLTAADRSVSRPSVKLYDTDFVMAPIDAEELKLFNDQFPTLLGAPGSEERRIQLERVDVYMMGLRAIKYKLNSVKFRGLNPSDAELGFGKIRPQFTCNAAAPAGCLTNWKIALLAGAWTDFLFTGAGIGYQLGKDFGLVVTHIMSYITPVPFVSEIHNKIGRTDLIPSDVRPIKLGDNENGVAHYPIPSMIMVPRDVWWLEIMADDAGDEEMAPCGIVVGLGAVLKETTPTWTA